MDRLLIFFKAERTILPGFCKTFRRIIRQVCYILKTVFFGSRQKAKTENRSMLFKVRICAVAPNVLFMPIFSAKITAFKTHYFMKQRYFQLAGYLLLLVAAAGCAGLNPPPNYKSEVSNWKTITPPDSLQIKHSIFLIGDVGSPKHSPQEPSLKLMRHQLEVADSNSTAIFLGDNVYSYGMPEPDAYDRKISERRLNDQLDILKNYHGEKFMIPGNHDWKQGLAGGWDAVIREEEYVESYLKDTAFVTGGDFFVP